MDRVPPTGKEEYQKYLESEEWKKIRERELKRADYHCERCGSALNLRVHHTSYDPPEYVVLCENCHKFVHESGTRRRPITERDFFKKYLPEYYDLKFGHLGSQALTPETIKKNYVILFGTENIPCGIQPVREYLSEQQNKHIKMLAKSGLAKYEIKNHTGYSDKKITKVLKAMKEDTNEKN